MKTLIPAVKGTRDFYPEEMAFRSWLYSNLREVSLSYGYQEYEGPILEKIDLYAAKSGEELVKEQAFVFPDRGGDLITLRPELTPTLARMIAQKQNELVLPVRWWSYGPFWRYERPQKGRTREFFQWNIDLLGVNTPEADGELVSICATFFRKVGLTPQQVQIFVNDRRLVDAEMDRLGVLAEKRKSVLHIIDRRDKLAPAAWEAYALETLSQTQFEGLKTMLADKELWRKSPELLRIFETLDAVGVRDYVHYDPQIVRGLDYYTGIIFEARDIDREGRAILGGGHYDNLVADVGGDPMPGVGFAMGDVMIGYVMQKYGVVPAFSSLPDTVLVTVFDEDSILDAYALGAELRQAGLKVVNYPEAVKLGKQMKYADRQGLRWAVIIGPDERREGLVTVKDLTAREQFTFARSEAPARLRQMLAHTASV